MLGGGRQQGGGRTADSADLAQRFAALERLVHSLRGGGKGGGGGKGKGDGGSAGDAHGGGGKGGSHRGNDGAGAGGSGRARMRPGDWVCGACGATPCFGRTTVCFRCGASRGGGGGRRLQRDGASGAGGGISRETSRAEYLGPVGAGGSRPLLGGRGGHQQPATPGNGSPSPPPVATSPTYRIPGSSVAAKAEQRGRPHQGGRGAAGTSSAAVGAATYADKVASPNSWAALPEEDDDEDDDAMEGVAPVEAGDGLPPAAGRGEGGHGSARGDADGGDEDREQDQDAPEQTADAAALRREWISHCAACRLLERDGRSVPSQLLAEAKAQRDEAERRWRAAKAPHPLHKRLRWAENELREAEGKERARRDELNTHLKEAAERTREIEQRLEVDIARTARKREALDMLHREGMVGGAQPSTANAARVAAEGISSDVAPALLAAIERLGTSLNEEQETARRELQLVAVSLGRVEEVLRRGVECTMASEGPELYDIGDGDIGTEPRDGDRRDGDNTSTDGGGGAHHPPAAAAVPRWVKAPNGPWRRGGSSSAAVEEARRYVRRRTEEADGAGLADGNGPAATGDGQWRAAELAAAATNDLAVAERVRRDAANRLWEDVQGRQQQQKDAQQLMQEDILRRERDQRRLEELQRHQDEMQKAAAQRQAEEARQRSELIASMSPAQLALAAEVHAQQAAIGAKAFGSPEAAAAAAAASAPAPAAASGHGGNDDAERLMQMSDEEYAQWNRDAQEQW